MKKIAIFAEGQTEQLIVEKIIKDAAGTNAITLTKTKAIGRSKSGQRVIEIFGESEQANYFVLVVDCGTDNKVKSDILENHNSLYAAGYQKIIGIQDAYPTVSYSEISKLRAGLQTNLSNSFLSISFILGVMEIEAWLLAEGTHFSKIDPKITIGRIKEELGIDIINDDLAMRPKPSKDLADVYWLECIEYNKSMAIVNKILSTIDMSAMKHLVSTKFSDLQALYQELDLFFSN